MDSQQQSSSSDDTGGSSQSAFAWPKGRESFPFIADSPPRRFPGSSPAKSSVVYSDRLIPNRFSSNLADAFDVADNAQHDSKGRSSTGAGSENQELLRGLLRSELLGQPMATHTFPEADAGLIGLGGDGAMGLGSPTGRHRHSTGSTNMLKYQSPQKRTTTSIGGSGAGGVSGGSPVAEGSLSSSAAAQRSVRKISRKPYKVLEAPNIHDDYYLNLVDWSHGNIVAVALGACVYLWSAHTAKVTKLCEISSGDTVTSVTWSKRSSEIAIGTNTGHVQVWDSVKCARIRDIHSHANRVGAMAWSSALLATGSRDRSIHVHDVRIKGGSSGSSNSSGNNSSRNNSNNNSSNSSSNSIRSHLQRLQRQSSSSTISLSASDNSDSDNSSSSDDEEVDAGNDGTSVNDAPNSSPPQAAASITASMSPPLPRPPPSNASAPQTPTRNTPSSSTSASATAPTPPPTTLQARIAALMEEADDILDSGSIQRLQTPISTPDRRSTTPRSASNTPRLSGGGMFTPISSPFRTHDSTNFESGSGGSCLVYTLLAHQQEVCGLKWSHDERMLASGGNDNMLHIWNPIGTTSSSSSAPSSSSDVPNSISEPMFSFTDHIAAVKAVAWSPHQHGLVASGGGTADRHIRFWSVLTGTALHRIDTGSQVCNLLWSKTSNEIVSTHGYSLNQVIVWKYPSMQKLATLSGHSTRVLYLAMSPDGQNIVTGAGDERLRFWNVFPPAKSRNSLGNLGACTLFPSGKEIR